ncbi:MAG: hypothetical protein SFU56_09850 [Capsulimonadales bacterium]|nr:hypothetical protein [Capsulimonadales bacterium]
MRNDPWSITFGDYEWIVDRRTLTFRLTETKTGTLWADGLSLGWIEIEHRETGGLSRHDFGSLRAVSVSEKAGPQGKRILFGLDIEGIPVDLYLICSLREIQLQVESNRDSRTHRVCGFGLVPGLCSVPDAPSAALVLPSGAGALIAAREAPETPLPLPIWDCRRGINMPFVGAVRSSAALRRSTALALLTDSAYGSFVLQRAGDGAVLNPEYARDPERRRLDLRLVPLPDGDAPAIARLYREKLIGENAHVTLRKKMRQKPGLAQYSERPNTGEPDSVRMETRDLTSGDPGESRWEVMDRLLADAGRASATGAVVSSVGGGDWANLAADQVRLSSGPFPRRVPLYDIVYRDAVLLRTDGDIPDRIADTVLFLRPPDTETPEPVAALYPRHFAALLLEHHRLTPDGRVEETLFSDRTRVMVNRRDTEPYEQGDVLLPPRGFLILTTDGEIRGTLPRFSSERN